MNRLLVLLLAGGAVYGAGPDPSEIVRRSVARDETNSKLLEDYAFLERVDKTDLDKRGNEKKRDIKAFQVIMLEGSTYRRLVSRNDQPLSHDEEAAEQAKLEQSIRERRNETPQQREKRLREYEKRRDRLRKAISEIPDAFRFRLLGDETVHSRPAYVIQATPRPGYRAKSSLARIFARLKGKLWIDKSTYAWLRVEAELVEDFTVGWILVRIHKGTRAEAETLPLEDGVWGMRRLWYQTSYRIGLIKYDHIRQEHRYSNYRKLPADSPLVSITPAQVQDAR